MAELNNPILQQTEDKVESGLTPENRSNYLKIVVAGQHVALDKGPNGLLASLAKSKDPIADAAKGAVSVVLILRRQAHGVMPLKAMVPAGLTLMLKALDFLGSAKIAEVGNAELVRATHIFTDFLFARFGITKAGLQNAAQRVQAITQDPQAMQAINLKAGLTRHPMAATPTPLPPGPGDAGGSAAAAPGPGGLINGSAA